jgi:hypothetical protein
VNSSSTVLRECTTAGPLVGGGRRLGGERVELVRESKVH